MIKKIPTFYIIFILVSSPAYGARPLSTEDAGVAGKGISQLEMGSKFVKKKNKDINYSFTFTPIYGITENMEFSMEAPYNILRPTEGVGEEGIGDLTLVLKDLVLPEKIKRPSFLLKYTLKLSNGNENKALGSGDEDIGISVVSTKSIGSATLHGNLGYTFVGREKDKTLNDYLLYGMAYEYSMDPKLSLVSEIYGESNSHFDIDVFKHHAINPLVGFTYKLTEKIIFDSGFKIGISNKRKEEYGILTGLSVTF